MHHLNYHFPSYQIHLVLFIEAPFQSLEVQPVGSFFRALHVARRSIWYESTTKRQPRTILCTSRLSVKIWDRGGSGAGHSDNEAAAARRSPPLSHPHRQQHQSMTMPPTLDADSPTRHPSDDEYGTHRGGVGNDDDDDDDEFEPSRETDDEEELGMSGQYVFMCRESNTYDE